MLNVKSVTSIFILVFKNIMGLDFESWEFICGMLISSFIFSPFCVNYDNIPYIIYEVLMITKTQPIEFM